MKKVVLFCILLMIACPLAAQEQLKVVTYNLQGMRPGTNYQVRLYFMIQFFKELDPDIICMQEINETLNGGGEDNMARVIADSLGDFFDIPYHYTFSQTHIAWDEFREGVGIVSKHPVIEEGFRSLPRGVFLRKVVWNHIDSPIGLVNIFSTHLSYLPEHNSIRVQQVQEIIEYISQKEEDLPSVAAIVGGDFNCTPGSEPISLLLSAGSDTFYFDTFAEANPGANGYTIPADAPTSRIDYIFYLSTGNAAINTSLIVMDEIYDNSHYCSDHLGVMTIFSLDDSKTDESNQGYLPEEFELFQNYPNPFNPQTTISYFLSRPAPVKIDVCDILGRNVATLVEEDHSVGFHTVTWNADLYSSGVYFYQMSTDKFSVAKKAILLK